MRLCKYSGYVQHQYLHQKFIKDLDNFNQNLYMDSGNANINQINTFITQWIIKHIAMADKDFAKFYNQHNEN